LFVLTHTPSQFDGALAGHWQPSSVQTEPIGHVSKQLKQLWIVPSVTHRSPHAVWPIGQAHAPFTQLALSGHWLPHEPQCAALFRVFTQVSLQYVCAVLSQTHARSLQNEAPSHSLKHEPQ
jgi:hypothetical protein